MARLDLTFEDIYKLVSDFLGLGTSPSGTNLTKVQNIVYRAYRQFLYPIHPNTSRKHTWSFLKKSYFIYTKDGVWKYQLPLDFDRMLAEPTYGDQEPYGPLTKVSPEMILNKRALSTTQDYPSEYALYPVSTDPELGTMWEIWLWPDPNAGSSITFQYLISPQKPSATTDVILGGPLAAETILEMAYAIAEIQEENTSGVHGDLAQKLLLQLILSDTISTPDSLGRLSLRGNGWEPRLGSVRHGTDNVYSDDSDVLCSGYDY
jgi:hypothetical protein